MPGIQTHITPPIKRKGDTVNSLYDRYVSRLPSSSYCSTHPLHRHGSEIAFYREVPDVLAELKKSNIHIAAASRTHAPDLYVFSLFSHGSCQAETLNATCVLRAREALGLLLIPAEKGASDMSKAITFFQTVRPPQNLNEYEARN